MKGLVNAVLALVIIVVLAGVGYLVANYTDVGKTSATPTPTVVAQAANATPPTPIPTFTPNPTFANAPALGAGGFPQGGGNRQGGGQNNAAGTPNAANTTPGAATNQGQGQGGQAGQGGQGQRGGNQVAGTVSSYDASAKLLTITAQNGNKREVSVANAIFTKADKVSLADIAKINNAIVVVTGEKGSDGTYTARNLMVIDPTAARGAGGFPGGGFPGGAGQGGFGGGQGGNLVILNAPTVSGNTLTGKTFQGEDVKVNVTDTTTMSKQDTATAEDLTEGKRVTVAGQAGSDGKIEATLVSIQA